MNKIFITLNYKFLILRNFSAKICSFYYENNFNLL